MNKSKPIPPTIAKDLKYHPETGAFEWTGEPAGQRTKGLLKHTPSTSTGYLRLQYDGSLFACHRLAWYLHTGEDPGESWVDHLNGIRTDNRISNLRLVDQPTSGSNAGQLGYSWNRKRQVFESQIYRKGKQKYLGDSDCPLLARLKYVEAVQALGQYIILLPRKAIKGRPDKQSHRVSKR